MKGLLDRREVRLAGGVAAASTVFSAILGLGISFSALGNADLPLVLAAAAGGLLAACVTSFVFLRRLERARRVTEDMEACNAQVEEHLQQEAGARQAAENALRERNEFIATVTDNLPIGFGVHTIDDGRCIYMSRRFEEIYGVPSEQMQDVDSFFEHVYTDPAFREEIAARVRADMASGDPARMRWDRVPIERELGNRRYVDAMNIPMPEKNFMVSTVMDVTERENAAEDLRESEERFRTLVQQSPFAIVIYDVEGTALQVNRAWEELWGSAAEGTVGKYNLFRDRQLREKGLLGSIERVVAGEAVLLPELEYDPGASGYAGRKRCVRTRMYPLVDRSGRVQNLVVIHEDVTERAKAEQALRAREAEDRLILQSLSELVTYQDRELRVHWANEAACQTLDLPATALIGRHCYELWCRNTAPPECCPVAKCMETGRLEEAELETPDGRAWLVRANPARDPDGGIVGAVEVTREITERRRAEEAHRKLEAQVQQAQKLESLGILAGGIAHDFNNLLAGILGNADLALANLPGESRVRENLAGIKTASRRAADLCRQMLAYSGKGRFVVERINLTRLVEEMAGMLNLSISKKATLECHLAEEVPEIEADATQIRQVVMNLITNASDALSDRSGVISVSTGTMACDRAYLGATYLDDDLAEGTYVYCEVADTGTGIGREVMKKLFEPFYTTKFPGRGLGLAAVLGIVRGHKGAMQVQSEPGKGATFRVLFPAVEPSVETEETPPPPHAAWRGQGTILLIDDEETVRLIGERMLKHLGFSVLVADDGLEGLGLFREHRDEITCVLMDLTMPKMDGGECLRALRGIDPDVRVILSSGYNEQDVITHFAGKGLAGFIQKPYELSALREMLRRTLSG